MTKRPTGHQTMMRTAVLWGQMSTCSRLSVGAVLALEGRLIGTGYNGAPRGITHCLHPPGDNLPCLLSKHAEENAVANAAYHGNSTRGATLFVTHSPCYSCAGLVINAGIKRVYYGDEYRDHSGINLLKTAGILTRPGDR